MSPNDRTVVLSWQAPVGRSPLYRIAARVDKAAKPSRGLFGLLRSPSIAGPTSLPDPLEIEATVVFAPASFRARNVKVTAPKAYLPTLAAEDHVALSIVAGDVCVCIEKIPAKIVDAGEASIAAWLAQWAACNEQP